MRVAIADPSAFTPQYDHELAAALSRRGVDVELLTSRLRFGPAPATDGYRRREIFYPVSSRLFRRSSARLPLKLLEHPLGLARLARPAADVLHLQWLVVPELEWILLHARVPKVFTAHNLSLSGSRSRRSLLRRLLRRFQAVVVHSGLGREHVVGSGVKRERVRVIPHPVFRSDVLRRDDGRTLLCLGLIRSYKGLADAIEATKRIEDARLLVAGDAMIPIDGHREAAGGRAEWRVRYLSEDDIQAALAEATIALFPYRHRVDQSGALMRVLGAGIPAVVYDVGALAEPVRRYEAGRVVVPGDVDAFTEAIRELLDPEALARARAGAARARDVLTWDAAADAHLELYAALAS